MRPVVQLVSPAWWRSELAGREVGLMAGAAAASLTGPRVERQDEVLTADALEFVAELQRRFGRARQDPLAQRQKRRAIEGRLRTNAQVGIRYIESWPRGVDAAAITNLVEDVAPSEICRSQVWQWVYNSVPLSSVPLSSGQQIDAELVRRVIDEGLAKVRNAIGDQSYEAGRLREACNVFEQVALADDFVDFLTQSAYRLLV